MLFQLRDTHRELGKILLKKFFKYKIISKINLIYNIYFEIYISLKYIFQTQNTFKNVFQIQNAFKNNFIKYLLFVFLQKDFKKFVFQEFISITKYFLN